MKYFYTLDPNLLRPQIDTASSLSDDIRVVDIKSAGADVFSEFTERTFYDANPGEYVAADREAFRSACEWYFKQDLFGKVYLKGSRAVALITTHAYHPHPATHANTLHIGYWSYDRSQLSVADARAIKADWFRSLANWSHQNGGIPIDVSIDYFNEPAFRLVNKLGFKLHSLRLDKRPS